MGYGCSTAGFQGILRKREVFVQESTPIWQGRPQGLCADRGVPQGTLTTSMGTGNSRARTAPAPRSTPATSPTTSTTSAVLSSTAWTRSCSRTTSRGRCEHHLLSLLGGGDCAANAMGRVRAEVLTSGLPRLAPLSVCGGYFLGGAQRMVVWGFLSLTRCPCREYYFSVDNLERDFFLRRKMDSEGFLPITLIASFHRVQALTTDISLIIKVRARKGDLSPLFCFSSPLCNACSLWMRGASGAFSCS